LLALAASVTACTETSQPRGGEPAPPGATDAADNAFDRPSAAIYAAVIRELAANRLPGASGRIFVRSVVVPGAGNPHGPKEAPRRALTGELRAAIAAELADVAPLTFVASAHPAEEGTLITLGPIRRIDARTAYVPNSRWATPDSGKSGQWLTYRVRLTGGSWRVAGTVGGVAVS